MPITMKEAADEIERLQARLFPDPDGPGADQERDHLAEQCSELLRENGRLRAALVAVCDVINVAGYTDAKEEAALKQAHEALGQKDATND